MSLPFESYCLACGAGGLVSKPEYVTFARVTSDCRPFPAGGSLAQCVECAAVQKIPDRPFQNEIENIYRDYQAYYQGDGSEQLAIDAVSGKLRPRSDILVDRIREHWQCGGGDSLLDIGCGSGVTLRAFSKQNPEWKLDGYELDEANRAQLSLIPSFRRLHTGKIGDISDRYQLISFIHSLEHFIDPVVSLKTAVSLLSDHGAVFIEVCNVEANPFDLLIADHVMHFSPHTLCALLRRCGLTATTLSTDWVSKEISLLACRTNNKSDLEIMPKRALDPWADLDASLVWLKLLSDSAHEHSRRGKRFGIFGTSIAGTWLGNALGDANYFFVDEDPARLGKQHLGKPIIAPFDVERNDIVFVGLTPVLAAKLITRLSPLIKGEMVAPPSQVGSDELGLPN